MLDDILKKIYNKYIKSFVKKYYKAIATILIYLLYSCDILIVILRRFGLDILLVPKTPRLFLLALNDLVYVFILLLLYKTEIINGIKKLKSNFSDYTIISLNCWIVGCLIMTTSTFLINLITGSSLSNNEDLIRQSITIAPLYMLFSCTFVAPILEEMTFRKALYNLIKRKWLFIILSGVCFGLLHVIGKSNSLTDFLYIIPYGAMGSCFAYLLTKTKNISLPIIIHMIHNFILVCVQILG